MKILCLKCNLTIVSTERVAYLKDKTTSHSLLLEEISQMAASLLIRAVPFAVLYHVALPTPKRTLICQAY